MLLELRELQLNSEKYLDKEIELNGWIKKNKKSEKFWIYRIK